MAVSEVPPLIGERVALVLGLFVAPFILALLGHRLRERSAVVRRRFWGGVIGHSTGLLIATAAMLDPPIWWAGGSFARDFAVHWSMLIGFLIGFIVGPWLPATHHVRPNAQNRDV